MEAPAIRQRMTLSEQLSVIQSVNLRDLLKVRDDDVNVRQNTVTLANVLQAEKNGAAASGGRGGRTLLDVIREEGSDRGGGRSTWRDFTDRLRIRSGSTSTPGSASSPAPALIPARESAGSASDRVGSGTIRVSLMTLMELREREEEVEEERGTGAVMTVGEADGGAGVAAAEEVEEEEEEAEKARHVCCVCMVRKKGAAFIPCGHTFCRVCSRELFAGRGNCPLCNASILEVLNIY